MTKLAKAINKLNSFPCTSCGSCCKRIDKVINNIAEFSKRYNIPIEHLEFPYKYDEVGKCEMLNLGNKCKVYNNRPNICNIEWMRIHTRIDREEFYNLNIKVCNQLMDEDGIDKSYRIVI